MDYVIIVGLVIVLVCVQFKVFLNNCKLIKEVENLFPLSNTLFVLQNSLKDNALIDDIHETGGNVESIKLYLLISIRIRVNFEKSSILSIIICKRIREPSAILC